MATKIALNPGSITPIKCVAGPIFHTIYQTSTVPTDLNYKYDVLIYNQGSVISIKDIPNASGVGKCEISKIVNSYLSFNWQPTITYSQTRPNSTINTRVQWSAYTGNTLIASEDTSDATEHYSRFTCINGSKGANWSYQNYILNHTTPDNNYSLSEFTNLYRKFLINDFATMTTFNGYVDNQQIGSTNYSQDAYMIVDVHRTGTNFDYSNHDVYSLQNFSYGSGLNTNDYTLQSTSTIEIEWPVGPANILANAGISTNPKYSFRHCYNSGGGEIITPAAIYSSAHYHSGTVMLENLLSYDIYWVSALPTFTGSAANWLSNLEKLRTSVKTNIVIDTECTCNPIEMSWLNEMGAFDYFSFKKANYKSGNINRKVYEKYPYSLNGMIIATDTYGLKAYDINFTTTYNVTSDWLSKDDISALETLFTSVCTYAKIDGTWYSIVLDNDTKPPIKNPKTGLEQYTISFTLSLDNKTISL